MKTVAITTLGCKTNQFESASLAESLERDGFFLVPFDAEADVYIINSCTVTAKTDAESRKLVRRARRRNPHARVVVTGCYAQVAPDEVKGIAGVDLVAGNREKKELSSLLKTFGVAGGVVVSDIMEERDAEAVPLESFAEHTRSFLQVQNGCDSFCSYCIVPYARGRSRSVPFHEALSGIRRAAEQGFLEVVLTGIHLGAYGLDLDPPRSLLALLEESERMMLVSRLRVGSVEPTEVTPEMIRFLSGSRSVCNHLHIPLQSGCDSVLRRMNRQYGGAWFAGVAEALAAQVPGISIGCDVIAGFPGETEEEFAATCRLLESLPVSYLHVFPFSVRPGTPAATMPDQVVPAVIKKRAQLLRELSNRKRRAFHDSFVGKELRVLVQGRGKAGRVAGLSRNYIPVVIDAGDAAVNTEVTVRVTRAGLDAVGAVVTE